MDCRFFMACMASFYTKGLLACGCLSVNGNVSDFTDIIITFNCNAITACWKSRQGVIDVDVDLPWALQS
jgi:hypothetical protein